ncbi:RNA pseudouridine synthase [Spirochaetia bacterium]|nr:RNA pseudouridine synthase [Spirochaetia bacterium]
MKSNTINSDAVDGNTVSGDSTIESRILYRSDRYLVINKLPGESVEGVKLRETAPGKSAMVDLPRLLSDILSPQDHLGRSKKSGAPFPITAVNRLDVPVSGCALFARTPQALAAANAQFRTGTADRHGELPIEKRYWAIIEPPGDPAVLADSGELVHWIAHDKQHNKSAAFDTPAPDRKKGILRYRLSGRGERYLFLEIELITGRHHQIRAQLAALGIHIKGDLKYGAKRSEKAGGIRLHARSLAFSDPGAVGKNGAGSIQVIAPPPVMDPLWAAFSEA